MAVVLPNQGESFLPWLDFILGSIDKSVETNRQAKDQTSFNQWAAAGYQGDMPEMMSRKFRDVRNEWAGQQLANEMRNRDVQTISDWANFNKGVKGLSGQSFPFGGGMTWQFPQVPEGFQTKFPGMGGSDLGQKAQEAYMGAQMNPFLPLGPVEQAEVDLRNAQQRHYEAQTEGLNPYQEGDPRHWRMMGYSQVDAEKAARTAAKLEAPPQASNVPWWANPEDENYGSTVAEAMRQREISGGTSIGDVRGRKLLDLEGKLKAGTATPEERSIYDKLLSGEQIVMSERAPKGWYDDLEKNILALDNVKRLKMHMQPGKGGADTVGVRDQIVTWIQRKFGIQPPDKAVYQSDRAAMYRLIKQASQEGRMSDQDLQFLVGMIPSEWQSDESFRAVLDSLESQAQAEYNRRYDVLSDPSMKAAVPASYRVYYTGGTGQQQSSAAPTQPASLDQMSDDQLAEMLNQAKTGTITPEGPAAPARQAATEQVIEPTIINPQTGERMVLRNGQWQPIP